MLSRNVVFEVIVALTPSLLFFFYLRGESERGSWSPDYHLRPPLGVPPGGRTSFTRYPLRGMKNDGANVCTNTSENCLYASGPGSKVEPKSSTNDNQIKKGDINSDCYLLHFKNVLLPKVTQKPSRIVKENEATQHITFNARQSTDKLL